MRLRRATEIRVRRAGQGSAFRRFGASLAPGVLAPEPLVAGFEREEFGAVLVRAEITERQHLLRRRGLELGVLHRAAHGQGEAVEHGAGHAGWGGGAPRWALQPAPSPPPPG